MGHRFIICRDCLRENRRNRYRINHGIPTESKGDIRKMEKAGRKKRARKMINGVEHGQCKCGNWTIQDKYRYIICDDCRAKRKIARRKSKQEKGFSDWEKTSYRRKIPLEKNFKISRSEINKFIAEYLESGGKIEKLQIRPDVANFPDGGKAVHEFLMEP